MIPAAFREIWEEGTQPESSFSLKLCGAGGGGFILGISSDWQKTSARLTNYSLAQLFD